MAQEKKPLSLQTDRLILKTLEFTDLERLRAYEEKNASFFTPWTFVEPLHTIEQRLSLWIAEYSQGTAFRFLVLDKKNRDSVIGICNFFNLLRGVFHGLYLGFKVDQDFEGKGFISEALQRLIQYLFIQENVHRITACYLPHNVRSENLLNRLGFTKECVAPKFLYINSQWCDHTIAVRLNPQWHDPSMSSLDDSTMPIIETERMILRRLKYNDIDDLMKIFQDSVAMKYYHSHIDRAGAEAWIARNMDRYKQDGVGFWACILKDTGQFVGQCGLIFQKDIVGTDEFEVGYYFVRDHWKKGLATEAARACRDYAFNVLGISKVISLIRPENELSQKVAIRNGMVKRAQITRWDIPINVWEVNA